MSTKIISLDQISTIPSLAQSFDDRIAKVDAAVTAVKAKPINDQVDQEIRALIDKIKHTHTDFNDKRKPITLKLQEIVKEFTSRENQLSAYIKMLQETRDEYAFEKVKIETEAKRKAEIAALKEAEKIQIEKQLRIDIAESVTAKIVDLKNKMITALKTVTPENKDERREKLIGMSTSMPVSYVSDFQCTIVSKYGNDVEPILSNIKSELLGELSSLYQKEIETYKAECLMMINQMAAMSESDKSDIVNEQTDVIKIEAATITETTTADAETQAIAQQASLAFATADSTEMNVKESIEITVVNGQGWAVLAAYWFANFGNRFDGNFETKTLLSMKKDIEKEAHKLTKKIECPDLIYNQKIKAK